MGGKGKREERREKKKERWRIGIPHFSFKGKLKRDYGQNR